MGLVITYSILIAQLNTWLERTADSALTDEGPYIMNLAEDRLAREFKILGVRDSVTGAFIPGQSFVQKPTRWRETDGINMGTGFGFTTRKQLFLRDYNFCRQYWQNPTLTGEPRYYADWTYDNLLIVPTPALANPFEFMFFGRAAPLDPTHQTNWWTANAPSIIHLAVMLEANRYMKNFEVASQLDADLTKAAQVQFGENARQKIDGASEVKEKR